MSRRTPGLTPGQPLRMTLTRRSWSVDASLASDQGEGKMLVGSILFVGVGLMAYGWTGHSSLAGPWTIAMGFALVCVGLINAGIRSAGKDQAEATNQTNERLAALQGDVQALERQLNGIRQNTVRIDNGVPMQRESREGDGQCPNCGMERHISVQRCARCGDTRAAVLLTAVGRSQTDVITSENPFSTPTARRG
jgi:hypothetical protein